MLKLGVTFTPSRERIRASDRIESGFRVGKNIDLRTKFVAKALSNRGSNRLFRSGCPKDEITTLEIALNIGAAMRGSEVPQLGHRHLSMPSHIDPPQQTDK